MSARRMALLFVFAATIARAGALHAAPIGVGEELTVGSTDPTAWNPRSSYLSNKLTGTSEPSDAVSLRLDAYDSAAQAIDETDRAAPGSSQVQKVSNGVQSGPPIGAEEGPPWRGGLQSSGGVARSHQLAQREDAARTTAVFTSGV